MTKQKLLNTFILLISSVSVIAQTNYYFSTIGSNTSDGLTQSTAFETINHAGTIANHGDTIKVMPGTYANANYQGTLNITDVWKVERTIDIKYKTTTGSDYLVVKPLIPNSVILKGDAYAIVQVRKSNYIRIEGFTIEGEFDNITFDYAKQYQFTYKDSNGNLQERVPLGSTDTEIHTMTLPLLSNIERPTYFNTSGISVNSSHHVDILNNTVFKMPGEGIRSFASDYLNINENIVYNCTRRSSRGNHGLSVYTLNSSIDSSNLNYAGVRVLIAQNKVYKNYNELYSWSQLQTSIAAHIDEGKGITIQRCTPNYAWDIGKIRIENNVSYMNGLSGIQINSGSRVEIVNNTCYENNYTSRVNNTGSLHGICLQNGNDILITNNIVQSDPSVNNGYALQMSSNSGNTGFIVIADNIVIGSLNSHVDAIDVNSITSSPLFTDPTNHIFSLQSGSPAINSANTLYAPSTDFFGSNRDVSPDIGAIEFYNTLGINNFTALNINIFPNPTTDKLVINGSSYEKEEIHIYDLNGQNLTNDILINGNNLDLSDLPAGLYILKIKTLTYKIYKQ